MIVDLPSTTTGAVSKKLVQLRNDVGAMALGRVLTLVIVVDEHGADEAIEAANDASRQHPCRIIAIVPATKRGANRLDAQIRVGGDAGASEVVVIRLYGQLAGQAHSVVVPLLLPDSPVVVWWPGEAPAELSTDSIGLMGQRRITDSAHARQPMKQLRLRAETYSPGDTDLAWTRITLWRGLLAAALDQPPFEPVTGATVTGGSDSPSTDLLAAWLANTLRCQVTRARSRRGSGTVSVRLERRTGDVDLVRPEGTVATLSQPGQPVRRITMAPRQLAECLADELRRLDPDEIYAETLTRGLPRLQSGATMTASAAIVEGEAPSLVEARKRTRALGRRSHPTGSSRMVEAAPASGSVPDSTVKQEAAKRLDEATSSEPVTTRPARKRAAQAPAERSPERAAEKKTSKAATKGATKKATAKRAAASSKSAVATPDALGERAKKAAIQNEAAKKAAGRRQRGTSGEDGAPMSVAKRRAAKAASGGGAPARASTS